MPRDGHFVVNGIQERTAAEGEATEAVLGAEALAGRGGASGGKRGCIRRQAGAPQAASEEPRVKRQTTPETNPSGQ